VNAIAPSAALHRFLPEILADISRSVGDKKQTRDKKNTRPPSWSLKDARAGQAPLARRAFPENETRRSSAATTERRKLEASDENGSSRADLEPEISA